MLVFFYGLFMDEKLLAKNGIKPTSSTISFLNHYALHIGERAALVHAEDSKAYGVLMTITDAEAHQLYAEDSVADYAPETVTVELLNGTKKNAACYNLPKNKIKGTNKNYAKSLLALATKLEFPKSYLVQIKQFGL